MVQHKYRILRPFAIHDGEITSIEGAKEKERVARLERNQRMKVIGLTMPKFSEARPIRIYKPKRNKNSWYYFDYASRRHKECQLELTSQLVMLGYLEHIGKRNHWGAAQPVVKSREASTSWGF